jgi:hypothetical protein
MSKATIEGKELNRGYRVVSWIPHALEEGELLNSRVGRLAPAARRAPAAPWAPDPPRTAAKSNTIQHVRTSKTKIECKQSEIFGSTTQFSLRHHARREQGCMGKRRSMVADQIWLQVGAGTTRGRGQGKVGPLPRWPRGCRTASRPSLDWWGLTGILPQSMLWSGSVYAVCSNYSRKKCIR